MSNVPTTVADIMSHDPRTITPDAPISDAIAVMQSVGCRHLPVVQGGKLVGILSSKDVRRGGNVVADVMTYDVVTAHPSDRLEKAAAAMAVRKVSGLPVVKDGVLVGIVTTYDLLDAFAKHLRG